MPFAPRHVRVFVRISGFQMCGGGTRGEARSECVCVRRVNDGGVCGGYSVSEVRC